MRLPAESGLPGPAPREPGDRRAPGGDPGQTDHGDRRDGRQRRGLLPWLGLPAWLLLLAACAKVGDPVPPEARPAEPAADLVITQRGSDLLVLEFTLPADARDVEVLRGCGSEPPTALLSLRSGGLQAVEGSPRRRRLELAAQPAQPCHYAVRVLDPRYGRSVPTPPVWVQWTQPPPCPRNPRAEVFPDHVLFRWDPPEASATPVAGYLVNGRHLVFDTRFRIEGVSFGTPLTLTVDAVSRVGNPMVVSAGCGELRLVPRDTFPPAVPEGLRAVRLPGGVQLLWDPVADPDLRGYRLYRRDRSGVRTVVAELVPSNQYLDTDAASRQLVYYEVTALDGQGNESGPSAAVEVPPEAR